MTNLHDENLDKASFKPKSIRIKKNREYRKI